MTVIVYPFKLFDPLKRRWRKARWKTSLEEIERLGGEVCGEAEIRQPFGHTSAFMANYLPAATPDPVEMHPHWENPPAIDLTERFLAQLFLKRYATWCVRKRLLASAQGAKRLYLELTLP